MSLYFYYACNTMVFVTLFAIMEASILFKIAGVEVNT